MQYIMWYVFVGEDEPDSKRLKCIPSIDESECEGLTDYVC